MYEHIERLQAAQDRVLHLWFEPWAEGLAFPPETVIELRASSTLPGQLELDVTPDRTAVYAWAGSTLQVFADGERVEFFDLPVPEALSRLMTREGMHMLFGEPPVPTPEERNISRKKPWWRFWR